MSQGAFCIRFWAKYGWKYLFADEGERGQPFKVRYGERCYANGALYAENLRTAANTDTYICKGSKQGEFTVEFLEISHICSALTKVGRNDVAAKLLMQKGNPGWLYSVVNGATTIWERWNSYVAETGAFGDVNMNSFNHYAYGAIGAWIYQELLGIKKAKLGYHTVLLQPKPLGGETFAKGYHIGPYGKIEMEWKREEEKFTVTCTIPAQCDARILLPGAQEKYIVGGGKYVFEQRM